MISQFSVLSARGDPIVHKTYRADLPPHCTESFYRSVSMSPAGPIVNIDGVNFAYVVHQGMYFVAVFRGNESASLIFQAIYLVLGLLRQNFSLTEIALRKNMFLVYEILDEAIDFGWVQKDSYSQVKDSLVNQPEPESDQIITKISRKIDESTLGAMLSVRLTQSIHYVTDANNYIVRAQATGTVALFNFVKGNPLVKVALDDIAGIRREGGTAIDLQSFGRNVDKTEWQYSRVLKLRVPEGPSTLLEYRIADLKKPPPFKFLHFIEWTSPYKLQLLLKLASQLEEHSIARNVVATLRLPKATSSVSFQLSGFPKQTAKFQTGKKMVEWKLGDSGGQWEASLQVRISLGGENPDLVLARSELGSLGLGFEVENALASTIRLRSVEGVDESQVVTSYSLVSDSVTFRL